MNKAQKLLKFLSENKEKISPLTILTHNYPDPDGIASAYGLQYLASNFYGIESKMGYGGVIGRIENRNMVDILDIPINKITQTELKNSNNIAVVDTQPSFQNNLFPEDKVATIVLDQHKSNAKFKSLFKIIDPACGATCVIVANALLEIKAEIPKSLATAIAYGISSETLNLYRGTSKKIIKTYLSILPMCDITALAQIQNPTRSKNFFKSLGTGIQNAVVCGKLIAAHLENVENPDLVSQTADFFLTYKDVEWSMCTGRYKENLHISLRSRQIDATAGQILREVVGDESRAGGHGGIAGGTVVVGKDALKEDWKKAEDKILESLSEKLHIPTSSCTLHPFRIIENNNKGG